jgi:predicted TIM-barrel fold metal-dependent hydrolase
LHGKKVLAILPVEIVTDDSLGGLMGRTAIISVDGHVRGSRPIYRTYVERAHLEAYDEWVADLEASGRADSGNRQPDLPVEGQWDSDVRIRDLETQGVVAEVLFPNGVPFQTNQFEDSGAAPDPELTRAGNAIYNRWLADFCATAPGRFSGQALVQFDDVERAVKDVHWAKEHGLGGIMMPALLPGGTFFFDPALDPVWAAIEETGLPISQHGGTGSPTYTPPGMAAILTLAFEHAFFSGRSLWQMIVGGVFDRYAGLKMAFVETEVHWIGPALQHFDQRMNMGDDWTAFASYLQRERAFNRLPSEYWETNCYAGISPFHPNQLPIEKFGSGYTPEEGEFVIRAGNAMFGVDYPHFESIFPSTMEQVELLVREPSMSAHDCAQVLFGNAAELYGFDVAALQPHVDRVGFDLDAVAVAV